MPPPRDCVSPPRGPARLPEMTDPPVTVRLPLSAQIPPPSMSKTLCELEDRGFVVRTPGAEDARQKESLSEGLDYFRSALAVRNSIASTPAKEE